LAQSMAQHRRLRRLILVVALVLAQTGLARALSAQETTPAAADGDTIQVTAKKYEFNPSVITVKQGQHVKLVITATDRDHGFKLAAYNIDQKLKKGVATPVEFTADKAGTFPFECSEFCGLGHGRMKGKLVVEPGTAAASP
jgi:cytochrome c oxidase subunit II